MLPLMIGDKIPQDNAHFELLLMLLRCMDLIFAPLLSVGQTQVLKHLIQDHHEHFKMLFPNERFTNKHHHMIHYPTCIRKAGPMSTMQCLKYEMKHGFSKRMASVNCNFKNICKSIAYKHQVLQCATWSGNGLRQDVECKGGCLTAVESVVGHEVIR